MLPKLALREARLDRIITQKGGSSELAVLEILEKAHSQGEVSPLLLLLLMFVIVLDESGWGQLLLCNDLLPGVSLSPIYIRRHEHTYFDKYV